LRAFTRLLVTLGLMLALAAPMLSGVAAVDTRLDEYQVKAAVLYNIAKFVDWPPDAFSSPTAPLVMCVLGVDPFGPALDETLKGHLVGKRAVIARRIAEVTTGCHLLFIAASERRRTATILDRMGRTSVLTVGEAEGFAEQGGMIGLVTEGDRVKFEINVEAVDRVKLKLSARLMALSSSTRRSGESGR
jgi:hypothetical protein